MISPPGMLPAATLFLHERRNSRGEARLVAVDGVHSGGVLDSGVYFIARTVRPATPISRPALLWETPHWQPGLLNVGRVMTGEPDPSDQSHFTLQLEVNQKTYVLDGWLRDDESVLLELDAIPPQPPEPEAN
jgi:hypothetical protein